MTEKIAELEREVRRLEQEAEGLRDDLRRKMEHIAWLERQLFGSRRDRSKRRHAGAPSMFDEEFNEAYDARQSALKEAEKTASRPCSPPPQRSARRRTRWARRSTTPTRCGPASDATPWTAATKSTTTPSSGASARPSWGGRTSCSARTTAGPRTTPCSTPCSRHALWSA